jgi:hypothetical protein
MLINLTTNLKSLRYGKDQLGGGYSGQPYIQVPIPVGFNNLQLSNNDFILRGGALAARDSATDVLRLGKMFADPKSPSGLLFIAKQNLLSRTAVRTQASGILNEGIYTPLSTLTEAGLVAFGGHVNKQGINPFAGTGAYSNNPNLYGVKVKNNQPIDENRLVNLYQAQQINFTSKPFGSGVTLNKGSVNVLSYTGGPGSTLGVGNTNIRYADGQQTGLANYKNSNGWYYGPLTWTAPIKSRLGKIPASSNPFTLVAGFSQAISEVLPKQLSGNNFIPLQGYSNNIINNDIYQLITSSVTPTKYTDSIRLGSEISLLKDSSPQPNTAANQQFSQNTFVYTQKDIQDVNRDNVGPATVGSPSIQDFRKKLRLESTQKTNASGSGATPISPSYSGSDSKAYEGRVNIGGKKGDGPGYKTGKNLVSYTSGSGIGPVDKINALPIYQSTGVALTNEKPVNDLVKFRIAVINNNNPTLKTFIHFRAFIDNFSDSYNATWNPTTYLGRGENFYTYNNYTRTISMGWTVAAQSKQELIPMYKKLNYLASSLTPYYTGKGYMAGNLVQLTVGGYLYEQVGIINSITYDIPEESPWEIGINDVGDYDSSVKELPHIIRVTNFSFTPIQNFIPSVQPQDDENGLSRYISLDDGSNNNYGLTKAELDLLSKVKF